MRKSKMFYSALTELTITTNCMLYNQAHSDIALKFLTKKISALTFHIMSKTDMHT